MRDTQYHRLLDPRRGTCLGLALLVWLLPSAAPLLAQVAVRDLPVLRSIEAVNNLTNEEGGAGYPVELDAVITWIFPPRHEMVIQSGGHALYASGSPIGGHLRTGDRVAVRGRTQLGGYMPNVEPTVVRVLDHPGLPEPIAARWDDLDQNRYPNVRVRVAGRLLALELGSSFRTHHAGDTAILLVEGRRLPCLLATGEVKSALSAVGADVEMTGFLSLDYNHQQRRKGPLLRVEPAADGGLRVIVNRPPWADVPERRLEQLFRHKGDTVAGDQVQVRGVVTYASGQRVFIQSGQAAIEVDLSLPQELRLGDTVAASGTLAWGRDDSLVLEYAMVRPASALPPIKPRLLAKDQISIPRLVASLVQVEGRVTEILASQDETVIPVRTDALSDDGLPITIDVLAPPRVELGASPGDWVRVTGILQVDGSISKGLHYERRLMIRSGDDVELIARMPWWRRVDWMSLGLGAALAVALAMAWVVVLRREVRQQTRWLAEKSRQLEIAAAEAEAANQAKSAFLANMSHEIRTPMNGVLGMISLAMANATEPCLKEDLSWARRSAESLLAILNDVLDLSKIESGHMEIESVPLDLRQLVEEAVRTMTPNARTKGLAVRMEMQGDFGYRRLGDPVRLRQVLLNLISNAVKFTEAGWVRLCIEDRGSGRVRFAVTDTGIGIPMDKVGQILEPFKQADNSHTRRFGGTGLGLSISARLVEMMGSRLEIHSELGQGSTFAFEVTLPESGEPAEAVPSSTSPTLSSALTILVADDNPVNQRLIQRLLERMGHRVTLASNGARAVADFEAGTFDLVLMDIQMPEMDGFEATRAIRDLPGGANIPILAVTAHAMPGYEQTCIRHGLDGYLAKPLRDIELRQVIEQWSTGRGGRSHPTAPHSCARLSPAPLSASTSDSGD